MADDALYRAAKIYAAWLRDEETALARLNEIKSNYSTGDMLTDATALEKTILASAKGKLAPEAKTVIRSEQKTIDDNKSSDTNAHENQEKISRKYEACKTRMSDLLADSNRSCWRQPWENLESEFLKLHKKSKSKSIAAGALFRAAESRRYLAKCSLQKNDYRRAVEIYQSVPELFPQSALADDALLLAAQIYQQHLNDARQSKNLLTEIVRRYPTGDKVNDARKALGKSVAQKDKKTGGSSVELQMLSWDSIDKNRVKIILEFSGTAEFSARLVSVHKGSKQKKLYLDLNDASIAQSIKKGVVITNSLLQGIHVEKDKNRQSILRFDLREARRFDVSRSNNEKILTLVIDARKNVAPMDENKGNNVASSAALVAGTQAPPKRTQITPFQRKNVNDIARQLGLSIQTIFIDAGHGGKDPGTYHNNIIERLVTLDVAKTLGRLLENNGFTVVYSRTTDKFISLSQRTLAANAAKADLFISIHVNANDNPNVQGFETYYLDLGRSPDAARVAALENAGSDRRLGDLQKVLAEIMLTARVDESSRLAIDIQRVTLSRLKRGSFPARNNGVKSAPFHVLIGAQMPAVLVELGYCSNTVEAKRLANPQYRELLAQGLAEGIMAYRDRIMNRRSVQNSLTPKVSDAI